MASADGLVMPKPGIPKTLGILNVIFGVMLVLMGFCTIGSLFAAPALFQGIEKVGKELQEKQEAQEKANVKAIDDQIAAAKTDEEKKALEQQKEGMATSPKSNPMDMSAVTNVLNDPTIKMVNLGGAVTGLILHIMLLVSGIGLIRLTPWGRSLGVWWSVLMIAQVVALLIASILWVLPANQVQTEKQIAKLEEIAKTKGAGSVEANAVQMTKTMATLTLPMTVASSLTGLVYPIVLLILLNNPGARAACLARKPEELEGF